MLAASSGEIHHRPKLPSAGEEGVVTVVHSDVSFHHPPTRKDPLSTPVRSFSPDTQWIAAGEHRKLLAPASPVFPFEPDEWDPLVSVSSFSRTVLLESAFGQNSFSLRANVVRLNRFLFLQSTPWTVSVSLQTSPWLDLLITFKQKMVLS